MGRRVLRRYIWGYSVCLCPIKRTPGLYGLAADNKLAAGELFVAILIHQDTAWANDEERQYIIERVIQYRNDTKLIRWHRRSREY